MVRSFLRSMSKRPARSLSPTLPLNSRKRPDAAAVFEIAVQPIRRRPWKRYRNDRIELRQIASLKRKAPVDIVDACRNDGAVEPRLGRPRLRLNLQSIRPTRIFKSEQRCCAAVDREVVSSQFACPLEPHRQLAAVGRCLRCDTRR